MKNERFINYSIACIGAIEVSVKDKICEAVCKINLMDILSIIQIIIQAGLIKVNVKVKIYEAKYTNERFYLCTCI